MERKSRQAINDRQIDLPSMAFLILCCLIVFLIFIWIIHIKIDQKMMMIIIMIAVLSPITDL